MEQNDINIVVPQSDLSLDALFNHAFDRGAGRRVRDGLSRPWTAPDLEMACDALGRSVSLKTVENWRAGRARPSKRNIHLLSRVFSGGDRASQAAWLDALLAARDRAAREVHLTATPVTPPTRDQEPVSPKSRLPILALGGLAAAALGAAATALVLPFGTVEPALVSNIRFCTEAEFDFDAKVCRRSRTAFAAGTTTVYVSFDSADTREGQPFSRRWYRDGEMFLERDGFFDAVWEDWTWLKNPDGHDSGDYHLRVIVDGRVVTAGFTVAGG